MSGQPLKRSFASSLVPLWRLSATFWFVGRSSRKNSGQFRFGNFAAEVLEGVIGRRVHDNLENGRAHESQLNRISSFHDSGAQMTYRNSINRENYIRSDARFESANIIFRITVRNQEISFPTLLGWAVNAAKLTVIAELTDW